MNSLFGSDGLGACKEVIHLGQMFHHHENCILALDGSSDEV